MVLKFVIGDRNLPQQVTACSIRDLVDNGLLEPEPRKGGVVFASVEGSGVRGH